MLSSFDDDNKRFTRCVEMVAVSDEPELSPDCPSVSSCSLSLVLAEDGEVFEYKL